MTTDSDSNVDLAGLAVARLHSERLRVMCMMALFGVIAAIGASRTLIVYDGTPVLGWIVLGVSLLFLGGEAYVLAVVRRAMEAQRPIDRRFAAAHGLLECVYPIAVLFVLMAVNPAGRYTLLVSPGYAFLMILIAISVLRVDASVTAWTGTLATAGYATLVAVALFGGASEVVNPHPTTLYVNNTLMLALATGASVFVAREFRGYLLAAVREMEMRRQRDRLRRDLEVAGEIQEHLLPRTSPNLPGYDIAAVCRSADETGGDYYDWQEVGPRRVVFSLGDVTGHGVGPALVTAACRAFVRAIVANDPQPASVLHRANRLLHEDLPDGRFVTLVLVDLNADTHEAHLLSAGHGPTLLVRGQDGAIEEILAQGMPLALVDEQEMDAAVRCELAPGDLLVLCSDGFFEAINPTGELFGMNRLKELIAQNHSQSAAELLVTLEASVRAFLATAPQPDDMTALVIKRVQG
ncbi:MAG: PP2C family protein-serine/threonine phosphatase [Pirellulales bacterium]